MNLGYKDDFVIDICKCGHPFLDHFNFVDHFLHNIQGIGCKYCNCKNKKFDYTTTISEYYDSQENKK